MRHAVCGTSSGASGSAVTVGRLETQCVVCCHVMGGRGAELAARGYAAISGDERRRRLGSQPTRGLLLLERANWACMSSHGACTCTYSEGARSGSSRGQESWWAESRGESER